MEISGIAAEIAKIKAQIENKRKEVVAKQKAVTMTLVTNLMKNTPVHTGETVRNYAVGINAKPSGSRSAIGSGPTGATSLMPLGPEPRRAANEQAAKAEIASTLAVMTKPATLYVGNTIAADKWDLIDNGSAPTKDRARNPGGVSRLALQVTRDTHREDLV